MLDIKILHFILIVMAVVITDPKLFLSERAKKELYLWANTQMTLPHNTDGTILDLLNEEGKKKFNEINQLYLEDNYKDTIYNARVERAHSGHWQKGMNNVDYNDDDYVGFVFNTTNNITVHGTIKKDGIEKKISTSNVIFFKRDWALTMSGSLYKLVDTVMFFL